MSASRVDAALAKIYTRRGQPLTSATTGTTPLQRGLTSTASESPLRSFTAGCITGFGACLVLVAFVGVLS